MDAALASKLQEASDALAVVTRDRDWYHAVLLEMGVAVLVIEDDAIAWANERAATVFGYQRHELRGMSLETLLPERDRVHHRVLRTEYQASPTPRAMAATRTVHGLHRSGREMVVQIRLAPLRRNGALAPSTIAVVWADVEGA